MIHRSFPSLAKRSGVGADAATTSTMSTVGGWLGYGTGLAMLGGGILLGLRGNFLTGGLVVILAPVVGSVVGSYAMGGSGYGGNK